MKLTMLGTGNASAFDCYNTCFLLTDENEHFLVDGGGGNGIFHQLRQENIEWIDIHNIFVTHKHIDHIFGVLWMIRMFAQAMQSNKYDDDLRIYSHREVINILRNACKAFLTPKQAKFIDDRIHLITVHDGDRFNIMHHEVQFFDIHSEKDRQFGFVFEIDENRKIACCGDEPFNERNKRYIENSDWLLHEAFCLDSQKEKFKPYEKHHSTVKDACENAEKLKAVNLILYHTEETNLKERKKLYSEEGKKYYHGNLYVPDDLEVIEM